MPWFKHKESGQVFDAEGKWLDMARKNRDLEEVDPPAPDAPSDAAGTDDLDQVRADLDALGVRHFPNWKPETLRAKLAEARAAKG